MFINGFGAAALVAALIICVSAFHRRKSTAWEWFRSALICFALSALMHVQSLQASIASKSNGEAMTTTYEKYVDSVGFFAASLGFGIGGVLATASSGVLLLSIVLDRKTRQSIEDRTHAPQEMD